MLSLAKVLAIFKRSKSVFGANFVFSGLPFIIFRFLPPWCILRPSFIRKWYIRTECKTYVGLAGRTFKEKFNNHIKSFTHKKYQNETELSKYNWSLKNKQEEYNIYQRWNELSICLLMCCYRDSNGPSLNLVAQCFGKIIVILQNCCLFGGIICVWKMFSLWKSNSKCIHLKKKPFFDLLTFWKDKKILSGKYLTYKHTRIWIIL